MRNTIVHAATVRTRLGSTILLSEDWLGRFELAVSVGFLGALTLHNCPTHAVHAWVKFCSVLQPVSEADRLVLGLV